MSEWVKFLTTYEEMQKMFERIGIGQTDDFGQPYEEWFITDYDCYVPCFYDKLGEYENLNCYDVYPDINDYDDLDRYYIDELDAMRVPEHLKNYIDYEAYGRDIVLDEDGEFTDHGYVRDTGNSFTEVYDGNRENIPEEYRVMNGPEEQELSDLDKLDMATDLAFDLDEFFRQHDPQYATQHPDPHEQKEVIAAICRHRRDRHRHF